MHSDLKKWAGGTASLCGREGLKGAGSQFGAVAEELWVCEGRCCVKVAHENPCKGVGWRQFDVE